MLVADHLGVDAGQIEVGRGVLAAPGQDHLGFGRLAQQGLHDRLHRNQLEIHGGVDLIEDHRFVEAAGDRRAGNFPGPLRFDVINRLLLAAPDDRITAGAQVIDQMRVALAQGRNGGVLRVAIAPLQPLQDQDPMALVLGDAAANGL